MKAITTRYLPATNHRGARYVASDMDGNRVQVMPPDNYTNTDACHKLAARKLLEKLGGARGGLYAELAGGETNGGMVWVIL